MRTAAIFALLTVFFGFVFLFLLDNQSPLDTEALMFDLAGEKIDTQTATIDYINESIELGILSEYVNYQNLVLVGVFFSATIFSFLSSLQILIDKFFFRKFYESPRYMIAYRRAGSIIAVTNGLILLRIFLGFDPVIAITIVVLFGVIELFMTFGVKREEVDNNMGSEDVNKMDPTKQSGDAL